MATSGNDTLVGGPGNDMLDGQDGDDNLKGKLDPIRRKAVPDASMYFPIE